MSNNSDREWEKFGQEDPYFGVAASEKYKSANLTEESKTEFFESGREHVSRVMTNIRDKLAPDFVPQSVLDFGCGVGRLVVPFAELSGKVTGVDVSESMLSEAKKNCAALGIDNAYFVKGDDDLSELSSGFDLVHSFIVFQHIPPQRGEHIIQRMLELLKPGGIAVIHMTFAYDSSFKKLLWSLRTRVPLVKNLINVYKGRPFSAPQMEMNVYDLNRIHVMLQNQGVGSGYNEYTNHGGYLGVILYFQKPGLLR